MSASDLLRLGTMPISRLIVGPGEVTKGISLGFASIGFLVTSQILRHCNVPPSTINDPSVANGRSAFRDEHGYDRARSKTLAVKDRGGEGGGKGGPTLLKSESSRRGKAMWSYTPFVDYNGLYCDHLVLGHAPNGMERTGVLQPHTGASHVDRALFPVLAANRHLDGCDVLLLYPTRKVPFGGAVLTTLRGTERRGLIDPLTQNILLSANEAVVRASSAPSGGFGDDEGVLSGDPNAGLDMSVLSIGAGSVEPSVVSALELMMGGSSAAQRRFDTIRSLGYAMDHSAAGMGGSSSAALSSSPFPPLDAVTSPLHSTMPSEMLAVIKHHLAPKLAFACAYWACNPKKASELLAKDFASPSPSSPRARATFSGIGSASGVESLVKSAPRPPQATSSIDPPPSPAEGLLLSPKTLGIMAFVASRRGDARAAVNGINRPSVGGAESLVVGAQLASSAEVEGDDGDGGNGGNAKATCAALAQLYASKTLQRPLLDQTNHRILLAFSRGVPLSEGTSMGEVGTLNASARIMKQLREDGYWTVPNE